jgi:geranylgeranyl pyrophosphate synthase
MRDSEAALRDSFLAAQAGARRIVYRYVSPADKYLRKMIGFALDDQNLSEYPFILDSAFSRREGDGGKIARLAACIHLLQSSTFITDDIFDRGVLRYGRPAVHCRYGISDAIIVAELLQSAALQTAAEELASGRFSHAARVNALLNRILVDLYVGQSLDLRGSSRISTTRSEYYRIIGLGAGRFLSTVARCGALLAGKPPLESEALAQYGHAYGMALFILDDVVDVLESSARTGKTERADIKQRRMRLPMICALQLSRGPQRGLLRDFLLRRASPGAAHVAALLHDCGAVEASVLIARRWLRRAIGALAPLHRDHSAVRLQWLAEDLWVQSLGSWATKIPLHPAGHPRRARAAATSS